jgi:DNA-binding HxlR family transcriptional regulator
MNAREADSSPPGEKNRGSLVVGLLMGRWTLKVLAELSEGGRRYQDLHDALAGISHKVLTDTLRRAERDGLVMRHVDARRIETATLYRLTDLGRSLDEPLAALGEWSASHWDQVEAARQHWNQRSE